jgi:hypothetical protein
MCGPPLVGRQDVQNKANLAACPTKGDLGPRGHRARRNTWPGIFGRTQLSLTAAHRVMGRSRREESAPDRIYRTKPTRARSHCRRRTRGGPGFYKTNPIPLFTTCSVCARRSRSDPRGTKPTAKRREPRNSRRRTGSAPGFYKTNPIPLFHTRSVSCANPGAIPAERSRPHKRQFMSGPEGRSVSRRRFYKTNPIPWPLPPVTVGVAEDGPLHPSREDAALWFMPNEANRDSYRG